MESQQLRVIDFGKTYNLNILDSDEGYVLSGIVFVRARINDYSINKNYSIRVEIPKISNKINTYLKFVPKVQVLNGMHYEGYPHVYRDKYICLDTDLLQYKHLVDNDFDYNEWFRFYFYTFAVKYEFYVEYGNCIGEERSHGDLGILESLVDYLGVSNSIKEKFIDSIKHSTKLDSIISTVKRFCFQNKKEFDWYVKRILEDYLTLRGGELNG